MDELENDIEKVITSLSSEIPLMGLEGKRVLIFGASGIIGLHLAGVFSKLISNGMQFSLFGTYRQNFEFLERYCPNLIPLRFDSSEEPMFSGGNVKYDIIFFAIGYGQPGKFLSEPIETIKLNSEILLKAFSLLAKDGILAYFSSSEVYSGSHQLPHSEKDIGTTTPEHVRAPYIESKKIGETICYAMSKSREVRSRILRVSLIYGPGTRLSDQRVLNELIKKASEFGEIQLLDSGHSTRAYLYISDAISMILRSTFFGKHDCYNIGGSEITSIRHLAERIADYLQVNLTIPKPSGAVSSNSPETVILDCSRYEEEFEIPDFTDLSEGLRRTILWQKKYLFEAEKNGN